MGSKRKKCYIQRVLTDDFLDTYKTEIHVRYVETALLSTCTLSGVASRVRLL